MATGAGVPVKVNVFETDGTLRFTLTPFDNFSGGATVATGDVTGDGIDDILVGAGAGAGPHVKVFDGATGTEIRSFFAFDPAFSGGVSVRAGDVDGDGIADIIVGAGPGAGPHIRAFSGTDLALLQDFFAGDPADRGGALVGVGNFVGDGRLEIVASVGGRIHVFGSDFARGSTSTYIEQESLVPFGVGINAAPATVRLDTGNTAILIGAVSRGSPHVKIIDGTSNAVSSFLAFDETFRGGVNVG